MAPALPVRLMGSVFCGVCAAVVASRSVRREYLPLSASPGPPTTTGADKDARRVRPQDCRISLERPLLHRRCTVAPLLRLRSCRSATTSEQRTPHATLIGDMPAIGSASGHQQASIRLGCLSRSRRGDEGYVGNRRHPPQLGPRRRLPCRAATYATAPSGGGGTAGAPCTRTYLATRTAWPPKPAPDTGDACSPPYVAH